MKLYLSVTASHVKTRSKTEKPSLNLYDTEAAEMFKEQYNKRINRISSNGSAGSLQKNLQAQEMNKYERSL